MGCCEGKDFRQERKEWFNPPIDEITAYTQRFLQDTDEGDSLAEIVKELHDKHDWKGLAAYVSCRDKLTAHDLEGLGLTIYGVESIGELTLYFILRKSKDFPDLPEEVVKQQALQLMQNLYAPLPQLAYLSLSLLHLSLKDPRDSKLKRTLGSLGLIEAVLPLYDSSQLRMRSLASHVCSQMFSAGVVYRKQFLDLGGHKAIAQLVIRDGDDDNVLLDLMEDVLDLIYVRTTQDEDGMIDDAAAKVFSESLLVDYLQQINYTEVRLYLENS